MKVADKYSEAGDHLSKALVQLALAKKASKSGYTSTAEQHRAGANKHTKAALIFLVK